MSDNGQQASGEHNSEGTEEQRAGDEPYFADVPLGTAWGESITNQGADA